MFLCVWGSPAVAVIAAFLYGVTFRDDDDFSTIEDLFRKEKRGKRR